MTKLQEWKKKWRDFKKSASVTLAPVANVFTHIGYGFQVVINYIVRLHKVFLAIPVVAAAGYLAQYSFERLPETVGLDLQVTGQYTMMVSRETAVLFPLAVTAGCLLLMFCSRRAIYPWLVSVFSLVLPILVLITNIYPA